MSDPLLGAALARVRLVVWDLDGTLYQDTAHFDYYASVLAARLPGGRRAAYLREYRQVLQGRHTLRFGRVYDVARDRILVLGAGGRVREAYTWEGALLPAGLRDREYPAPVDPDQVSFVSVGDRWYVPHTLALHHGLPREAVVEGFLETRAYMDRPEFRVTPVPGLRQAVLELRGRGVVQALVSNSVAEPGELLLRKLGLDGLFEPRCYEAGKPASSRDIFCRLSRAHAVPPGQVLSIGDNYWNEILPAYELGCRTLFIDPYGYQDGGLWDVRLASTEEALPYLRQVGTAPGGAAQAGSSPR